MCKRDQRGRANRQHGTFRLLATLGLVIALMSLNVPDANAVYEFNCCGIVTCCECPGRGGEDSCAICVRDNLFSPEEIETMCENLRQNPSGEGCKEIAPLCEDREQLDCEEEKKNLARLEKARGAAERKKRLAEANIEQARAEGKPVHQWDLDDKREAEQQLERLKPKIEEARQRVANACPEG